MDAYSFTNIIPCGRIVERGTHAELLARGGLCARLYDEQFRAAAGAAAGVAEGDVAVERAVARPETPMELARE